MPARRPLRRPFVVTIVATAVSALGACGGAVEGGGSPSPTATQGGNNPPAPICPDATPDAGTPCSGNESCTYDVQRVAPDCQTSTNAQCIGGKWQISHDTCNPPAPVCPLVEPLDGSPCVGALDCPYEDRCNPSGHDRFQCVSGKWQGSFDSYAVMCPATAPLDGAPCACAHHLPPSCGYDDCLGRPSTEAKCDAATEKWTVMRSTCNPPAVDGGTDG